MDRNTVTGLVLIAALLLGYQFFLAPKPQSQDNKKAIVQDNKKNQPLRPTTNPKDTLSPQADSALRASKYGIFAPLTKGENQVIDVETDLISLKIHTKGAQIRPVTLKKYKMYDRKSPLVIIPDNETNLTSLILPHDGRAVDTRDLYFSPSSTDKISLAAKDQPRKLSLKATLPNGKSLEHILTFHPGKYHIDHQIVLNGIQTDLSSSSFDFHTLLNVPQTEIAQDKQFAEATAFYRTGDDIDNLDPTASEPVEKKSISGLNWLCFKSQFFSNAFLASNKSLTLSTLRTEPLDTTAHKGIKKMDAILQVPFNRTGNDTTSLKILYTPNDHNILTSYGVKLERIQSLGWAFIKYINIFVVIPVFHKLESYGLSYGVIILLLALLIKICLLPITNRMYGLSARMAVAAKFPEIRKIDETIAKTKDMAEQQKLQAKKMSYMSAMGLNMFSSCWLGFLQLPFLMAFLNFFPQAIELRQQSFLWASDLSTYDAFITFGFNIPLLGNHISLFAILMTITSMLQLYFSNQTPAGSDQNPVLKYLPYGMTIFFFFFMNSYSAGLSYYYFIINILTIIQTIILRKMVDENALHQKLQDVISGKVKPPKSWLERMTEAAEARQKAATASNNASKKQGHKNTNPKKK